jgi:excinuclease ABC subunit B
MCCKAIWEIQQDLVKQVDYFKEMGAFESETARKERTNLVGNVQVGYCSKESRIILVISEQVQGTRPFLSTLFSKGYLVMVDESRITLK